MGVEQLQQFVEGGHVEGVAVPTELLKIARACGANLIRGASYRKAQPSSQHLRLILDAECCLDRLYGGFFSDWTCGGQWNRMIQYLQQFVHSCVIGNIELVVAFNGAIEQQRMAHWFQKQSKYRENIQFVLRHIQNKGTPPPKVLWVPPVCLHTALRMALHNCGVTMLCTMDDHHQEVLAYCRENNMTGIIGDDGDYIVFDPPRLFSASSIKLTYKGSIETKEYLISLLASKLELTTEGLCILGALLGSYLLPESQLASLYSKLDIDPSKNLENAIKGLAAFVKTLENKDNLESLAVEIFGNEKGRRNQGFIETVQYYLNGTKDGFLKYRPRKLQKKDKKEENEKKIAIDGGDSSEDGSGEASGFASDCIHESNSLEEAFKRVTLLDSSVTNEDANCVNGLSATSNGPSDDSPTSVKTEIRKMRTQPPADVLRIASERHLKGLMSPFIYQILTQGEIKLPVIMEDDRHQDIESIHSIYRPVRQSVYAILFNVHHQMYIANKDLSSTDDKIVLEPPSVKEWVPPYNEPDVVRAQPLGWGVPTVQRLWLGKSGEDIRRRLRAFYSCMRSDSPLMLSTSYVPQHLMIMAAVLRYLMQVKPPVLRQLELDAFLVTAFSPDLVNADANQDLQLQVVTTRGVQLAALFMQGVEMAILVNEVCGVPIPIPMTHPWNYFDGKLFHNLLIRAENVKSLQELCGHRMEMVVKVERIRHAILEELNVSFARRIFYPIQSGGLTGHLSNGIPAGYNPHLHTGTLSGPSGRGGAAVGRTLHRGGATSGGFHPPAPTLRTPPRQPVDAHGGHLEVAGVVVCKWGPNYSLARGRKPTQGLMRNYMVDRAIVRPGYPTANSYRGFGVKRRSGPGGGNAVTAVKPFRKKKQQPSTSSERKKGSDGASGDTVQSQSLTNGASGSASAICAGRGITDANSISRSCKEEKIDLSDPEEPDIGQFDLNQPDL